MLSLRKHFVAYCTTNFHLTPYVVYPVAQEIRQAAPPTPHPHNNLFKELNSPPTHLVFAMPIV